MEQQRKDAVDAGFTLLELMIALMLTGFVVMIIYSALNLTLKGWRRSQSTAEMLQELRVGQTIVERSLSSAVSGSLDNRIYFTGDPKQMRFFTLVPLESDNLGGIYHWRLLVGRDEAGQGILAVEQTKNINWRRDPEGVEVRKIIIRNLTSVRFAYGRGKAESETWDAKTSSELPKWVKISLTPQGHQPLVWLIPIHGKEEKVSPITRQQ